MPPVCLMYSVSMFLRVPELSRLQGLNTILLSDGGTSKIVSPNCVCFLLRTNQTLSFAINFVRKDCCTSIYYLSYFCYLGTVKYGLVPQFLLPFLLAHSRVLCNFTQAKSFLARLLVGEDNRKMGVGRKEKAFCHHFQDNYHIFYSTDFFLASTEQGPGIG